MTTPPALFYTELKKEKPDISSLLPMISSERREIVLRRCEKDRLPAIYAELLLRYAAKECGRLLLPETKIIWNGKPHFASAQADACVPFSFNLTHAGNTVAVLLSDTGMSCGVDCEEIRPIRNMDAIAGKMFTDAENAWRSAQTDRSRAFFRLWTAKEAFIKYTGEGFSRPLHTIKTDFDAHLAKTDTDKFVCSIYHYETDRAILCAAVDVPSSAPEMRYVPEAQLCDI